MYNEYFTSDKMQIMEDIHATIDLLYITQCRATKSALLNRLRRLMAQLTAMPYSKGSREVPVEGAYETPVYLPQEPQNMPLGMQGMQRGMLGQQDSQGMQMPQGMQRGMAPSMPQGTQQGAQQPMGMPQMPPKSPQQNGGMQPPAGRPRTEDLKTFTIDELARYDGKGDNPAYVSVNGMVYDVTDQPGWAAGSHFGLKSGLDQTSAYISCHTGHPMIERLKLIGRLVK
jgi:predicted heme/steroid binding protein